MTDPKDRFTGLAQIYATARPSYPEESIQHIIRTARLKPADQIADVGAGTGISSRLFAERGFNINAIEPNEDMRKQGADSGTEFGAAHIKYLNGTGEATGLAGASQDLVLAAQAFHWMRVDESFAEFLRILKQGQWVALVWNERAESDSFTAEYGDALRMAPDAASVEMRRFTAREPLLDSKLFTDAHKSVFANSQDVDLDGLLRRAFSASYTPKEGPLADEIRAKLTAAFAKFERNGRASLIYETSVFMARKPN